MGTYLVLLGLPGAGKGTQAQIISKSLQLPHISSGDIFRENLKNKTELGRQAEGFINQGALVPDDLTIAMIRERLSRQDCKDGALLDGFPRTPPQAEALDKILRDFDGQVDGVPYIKVDEKVLVERLSGRWTCVAKGHVFHEKYNPPRDPGICDHDGSILYQREDDKPETVINRIRVYFEQTEPLIAYYRQRGLLLEVNGAQPIDEVSKELLNVLPESK
jgi:adenylate kinase